MSEIPTSAGPPDGKERRSRNRMPDTDWLTGLSSRAAFARQVGQADQDRDQFAVAIIGLGHIDEINRHVGFVTGDDLLRVVGQALADRVGVGTTVAWLGGAQFGLMTVGRASENVAEWIDPVVSTIGAVIDRWILDQIDFNGSCSIEPQLMVGAAGGYSGRVWADAAIALDVCEQDRTGTGQPVAIHDQNDKRFSVIRAAEQTNDDVELGLDNNSLQVLHRPVVRIPDPAVGHRWLRVAAATDLRPDTEVDLSILHQTVGRRLERYLIGAAVALAARGEEPITVTAPIDWTIGFGAGLDYWLTPLVGEEPLASDRLLFECTESAITAAGHSALALLAELVDRGFGLVLAGCTGGADTVAIINAVAVRYLKPRVDLLAGAERGDGAAATVVEGLATMAGHHVHGALILPHRPPSANLDPGPGAWSMLFAGPHFVEGVAAAGLVGQTPERRRS